MSQDLTFRNNQNWLLVYNVSQWAAIYDLTKARFRMQIRAKAGDAIIILAFDSAPIYGVRGTIAYLPLSQLLLISATYEDVRTYLSEGEYAHDLTLEVLDPISNKPIVTRDIAAGSLTVEDGVTLR